MKFDVRTELDPITEIQFADVTKEELRGTRLRRANISRPKHIRLEEDDGRGCFILIQNDDVDNLIKALQKAKELGWC